MLDQLKGAISGAISGFKSGKTKDSPITTLDGRPSPLAMTILNWQSEAMVYRDRIVNAFLGARMSGRYGGMQGLVRQAHNAYTPRNWENPPYSYGAELLDNKYLNYPWFFGNLQQIFPVIAPPDIKVRTIPLSADMKRFSAMVNALLDEECEYINLPDHIHGLVLGSCLYGSQCAYYSSRPYRGPADIARIAELCDPLSITWEPGVSLERAKYVIYSREILIEEARRAYNPDFPVMPERLDVRMSTEQTISSSPTEKINERCVETVAFIRDFEEEAEPEIEPFDEPMTLVDGMGNPTYGENGQLITTVRQSERVKMIDGQPSYRMVDKYPHGREIRLINKKIVFDEPNPYQHNQSPFLKFDNHPMPGMFVGLPEWYVAGDVPHVINECMSAVSKGARNSFNRIVVDQSALDDKTTGDITNDPDQIIYSKPNMADKVFHEVNLGGMGAEYFNTLTQTLEIGDKITGVNDAFRGKPSSSVTSGRQQEGLTAQASQRLAPRVKRLEGYLGKFCEIILNNAAQFRNPSDNLLIVSNVTGEQTMIDGSAPMIGDLPLKLQFKTKVVSYTGLPSDRQERLETLMKQLPAIGQVMATLGPEMAGAIVRLTDIPELSDAWDAVSGAMAARNAQIQQQTPPQNNTIPNTNGRTQES